VGDAVANGPCSRSAVDQRPRPMESPNRRDGAIICRSNASPMRSDDSRSTFRSLASIMNEGLVRWSPNQTALDFAARNIAARFPVFLLPPRRTRPPSRLRYSSRLYGSTVVAGWERPDERKPGSYFHFCEKILDRQFFRKSGSACAPGALPWSRFPHGKCCEPVGGTASRNPPR